MSTNKKSARERKRAKFSKPVEQRSKPSLSVLVVAGVAVLAGAAILLWVLGGTRVAQTANQPAGGVNVAAQNDVVRLPLSTFDDGQAHYYSYEANGVSIEYFVLKSSDGVVRAAFNACDVCYPAHLGYRQEGDEMVCNNCGQRFASVLINEVKGGCNPSPLDRTVEGDELVIRVDDILTGIGYFQ